MIKIKVGYGDVKHVTIGGTEQLVFLGGPCAIESEEHALMMAEKIGEICLKIGYPGYTNHVLIRIAGHQFQVFME